MCKISDVWKSENVEEAGVRRMWVWEGCGWKCGGMSIPSWWWFVNVESLIDRLLRLIDCLETSGGGGG